MVICDGSNSMNREGDEGEGLGLGDGESSIALQVAMKELGSLRETRERTEEMVSTSTIITDNNDYGDYYDNNYYDHDLLVLMINIITLM